MKGSTGTAVEIYEGDPEVIDFSGRPTALEAITRAEIDRQVATAKAYPRSPDRFLKEAGSMVRASVELAEQCTYELPGRGRDNKPIVGPSVRLAEIVAVCWGNLRVQGRVTDDDGRSITAQGVAIDLERNVGYSLDVRRGVVTKDGRRYGSEMVDKTCNAAVAIATRNCTFKAVPRAFVNIIWEDARRVARGSIETLPERVTRALEWFASNGIRDEQVYRVLEVRGVADLTLEHLSKLNGMRQALNDGVASFEELFTPAESAAPVSTEGLTKTEGLKAKLKGQQGPTEAA